MSEEQVAAAAEATTPSDGTDWRSSLSPELATNPSLQHIGSVEAMAKSYINAQKMVGAEKIAIPGSWATDEDWQQVYTKLGRPQKPEDYELGETEGDFADWFKETAHVTGLTSQQAQKLAAAYEEYAGQAQTLDEAGLEARRAEIETELRQEYGRGYDDKMARANELLTQFEAPDLTEIQLADGSLLGDNPEIVRFMVRLSDYVAEQISEDGLAGRDSRPGLSDQDIQARISDLTAKNSPYWEKHHPDHDRMVNEVLRLREQIGG
jgi:hypothetical protein